MPEDADWACTYSHEPSRACVVQPVSVCGTTCQCLWRNLSVSVGQPISACGATCQCLRCTQNGSLVWYPFMLACFRLCLHASVYADMLACVLNHASTDPHTTGQCYPHFKDAVTIHTDTDGHGGITKPGGTLYVASNGYNERDYTVRSMTALLTYPLLNPPCSSAHRNPVQCTRLHSPRQHIYFDVTVLYSEWTHSRTPLGCASLLALNAGVR